MKIKPIVFSFIVILILALVFLLATFWIIYTHFDDATAIKDAFNTTGSYFGGIATLGAATVAAYLFNDWREQQHHQNALIFAQTTLESYKVFRKKINNIEDDLLTLQECLNDDNLNNELDYISELYDEIKEDSYNMLTHFHYFHDDLVNFWYVSISKEKIGDDLDQWCKDIEDINTSISGLSTEDSTQKNMELIQESLKLLEDEFNNYLRIINDVILTPLRLER